MKVTDEGYIVATEEDNIKEVENLESELPKALIEFLDVNGVDALEVYWDDNSCRLVVDLEKTFVRGVLHAK